MKNRFTEQRFRFDRDRRVRRTTAAVCAVLALGGGALVFLGTGGMYLNAWLVATLAAILALFILSIPRYVSVTAGAVEIHCVVELTRIPISDIAAVRKVTRADMGPMIPLLAGYGFFGYYGYFFSRRRLDTVKIYAGEWDHFVEIDDIYEQKYYVSCRDADRLIGAIEQLKVIS